MEKSNKVEENFFNKTKELVKRPLRKVVYKIKNYIQSKKDKEIVENIIKKSNYEEIIIFENNFGWNKIMKQRPQQIASHFSKKILFIYGSYHNEYKSETRIIKKRENLFIIDLNLYRNRLLKMLKKQKNKYLMLYSTDYIPSKVYNKYFRNAFKLIYEYVDDIDEKLCGHKISKLLKSRHTKFVNKQDALIIATASRLYNNVHTINKHATIKLITNGVDYNHFSKKINKVPIEIEKIKEHKRPIIGYYGALASWFDYKLIEQLSKEVQCEIILIGLNYDESINKSGILNKKNIHYFGKKNYEELPCYSQNFDVCIIPFKINEITKSTSPVKLFEYMAIEKPIVTTDLPECRKYKSVYVSKTNKEFIQNVKEAIKIKEDKSYLQLLKKEAKENTWQKKCEELEYLLKL